ncbi:hypothetical protein SB751_33780, partial [Cupriavidus sp. SIMBA_020]|uniref:hypothetical protein n=1 Tax=Cupriavidus sp. SIMBA_020 TaxID=3085766 RepID=UPI00397BBE6B
MRDFRVGRDINVLGDMIVHDESQQYKPLAQCSSPELLDEERHRHEVLEDERRGKFNKLMLAFGVVAVLLFLAGG